MFAPATIPAAYRRRARGSLVVCLLADTPLGLSDTILPAGSVGFVQSQPRDGRCVVDFPWVGQHGVVPVASWAVVGRQPR